MSKSLSQFCQSSPFDAIRQVAKNSREFWSARDLHDLLGYSTWQKFQNAINRAIRACENTGEPNIAEQFNRSVKMVSIGSGAEREVEDYHLSRYACYLIAMNADPDILSVALAQKYFAIKTREAEVSQVSQDHINEVHRKIRDFNMLLVEKLRFTVEEKANMLALSGMLKELGFAANSFLDSSLAKAFYPWCEEQEYDMSLVKETKRARIVGYELNEDRMTYNWDKPMKRHVNSYPQDPFGLAWETFLVEYYWPVRFLPYITRKYKGEERAQNIEAGIKVITFMTGLSQQQITEHSKKIK